MHYRQSYWTRVTSRIHLLQDSQHAGVTASGVVSPAQEAQLVFSLGGKIKTVNVSVGDLVEAGQVLVEMEGQEQLEAAVSSAQYELDRAQQAIDDLTAEAETRSHPGDERHHHLSRKRSEMPNMLSITSPCPPTRQTWIQSRRSI